MRRWVERLLALAGGVGVSGGLLWLAERRCGLWEASCPAVSWESSAPIKDADPDLGYRAPANLDAQVSARYDDDEVIYSVRYRTDALGRRLVPTATGERAAHLIFAGCSVTFGEGVEDHETMPAQLARLRPDVRPYVYAYSGYGPQQALVQMQRLRAEDIAEPHGSWVYVFIDQQVRRAIGAMQMFNGWGRDFPRYRLQNGAPVRDGTFATSWPRRAQLYEQLGQSALMRTLGLDLPLRTSATDQALALSLIEAAADAYQDVFPEGRAVVVIYPTATRHRQAVVDHFAGTGVEVLDYAHLLDPDPYQYRLHDADRHPNPTAHGLIAEQLAADLFP